MRNHRPTTWVTVSVPSSNPAKRISIDGVVATMNGPAKKLVIECIEEVGLDIAGIIESNFLRLGRAHYQIEFPPNVTVQKGVRERIQQHGFIFLGELDEVTE